MRHYTHLSAEERDRIAELHAEGKAVSDIGRDSSTLSRKLKRNGRHTRCKPYKRLSGPALAEKVREHIADERWSPERIDKRLCLGPGGSSI
ncbi:helix-turn-helix domain-containing protein [Atopobium sp. oral taxon 416]|uniref:helix-turn-helix domain-containing protein n=1 Tax=Atopobium sp. oral taxon 416 TaxID=712157 RepID=UPI001BA98217|nr:helix-turn-helix domain-containing protein [Atopobium sp. oral taxon 416]QUC02179.1 helix-turn-helix domain-containing protein [Atopobium sp. oral taxon 416]